ncbi:MAG: cytochrome oxidase subunit III [Dehalococcoidia bacterium]|nr:cytochrome oxidase subunit III [Dehalococcoidia bacterium]
MSKNERAYQLWGWILFLVCAIFFIISAIQNHDIPYLIGSIVFLLACVLFLIPFVTDKKK